MVCRNCAELYSLLPYSAPVGAGFRGFLLRLRDQQTAKRGAKASRLSHALQQI